MRLPIFVSTTPSIGLNSTKMMIGKGDWKIIKNICVELQVFVNNLPFALIPANDNLALRLDDTSLIQLEILSVASGKLDIHIESL